METNSVIDLQELIDKVRERSKDRLRSLNINIQDKSDLLSLLANMTSEEYRDKFLLNMIPNMHKSCVDFVSEYFSYVMLFGGNENTWGIINAYMLNLVSGLFLWLRHDFSDNPLELTQANYNDCLAAIYDSIKDNMDSSKTSVFFSQIGNN